jgi:arabinofuranan 3-O-arabinosyltransferase
VKARVLISQPVLSALRRLTAGAGVALLPILGIFRESVALDSLALVVWAALCVATVSGWLQLVLDGRSPERTASSDKKPHPWAWIGVGAVVAIVAGVAAQTWFQPGTTLAGGDDVVPNGTAWIGRLFEPWVWSGTTLGEPSQLPMALPRAAMLSLTRAFGADPAIAHRILESSLFIGAGLGALALLASLRIGPEAALAGTAIYLFNPYVVTYVSPHDVYLAALFLLPTIPAALIWAGTGRLSMWLGATLVAATSPLIGYAFAEPPLVGMILGVMLLTPLAVAWVDGRRAALRSLLTLLLALPLLLTTSAYWMVPAIIHLSEMHLNQTGIFLGFNWTAGELRTTVRNAFWLNTRWMWIAPEYFPYARSYDQWPLSALRFALPALAFSVLALPRIMRRDHRPTRDRSLRLAVAGATAALFVIFMATGTKPPGNILFDRLYRLPYGWLLQEPERFVMVVALAYAILIAILVDSLLDHESVAQYMRSRHLKAPVFRFSVAPLAIGMAALVGFPLYTGALVPDSGPPLPAWANHARPQHVQMPAYWEEMARFADGVTIRGSVLVMPPDDYYEMPYTWYYGGDAFIAEMFNRHVLVPSYPPTPLIDAVNLTAQSILHRDWRQAEALVTALDAPLILVRRDIVTPFHNHSILPPDDLTAALLAAPNFVLVKQIGLLDLFEVRRSTQETDVGARFATINTQTPDLRVLSVLPPNTSLVSTEPLPQALNVVEAPPLELWRADGGTLSWQSPASPAGGLDRIAELQSKTVVSLDRAGSFISGPDIKLSPSADPWTALSMLPEAREAINNGDFAIGGWGPVSDCYPAILTQVKPTLVATVLGGRGPGGSPALELFASGGSACVGRRLDWGGGSLLISLMVDHIQGAAPEVCLWETGPNRCALLPSIPTTDGWSNYRAMITPDVGTKSLTLFLQASAYRTQSPTTTHYALVRVIEVPTLPSFVVTYSPKSTNDAISISVIGRTAISNGNFTEGIWAPVGDCNTLHPEQAKAGLSARISSGSAPGGLPALRLAASLDTACESRSLDWRGGPLVLSVMVHHVQGAPPRICMWETGPDRCAPIPSVSDESGWWTYRTFFKPDSRTTGLSIYLYADAGNSNAPTINEYADVRLVEVPPLHFDLLANPDSQASPGAEVVVDRSSFSSLWQGPTNAKHVLVDGMFNGWLIPSGSRPFIAHYRPANAFRVALWISVAAYLILLGILSWRTARSLLGRRPFRSVKA